MDSQVGTRSSRSLHVLLLALVIVSSGIMPRPAHAFSACLYLDGDYNCIPSEGFGIGAEIDYYSADNTTVTPGSPVNLSYLVDGTSANINGSPVSGNGILTVYPTVSTTYTLSVYGNSGTYGNDPYGGNQGTFPSSPQQESIPITVSSASCTLAAAPNPSPAPGSTVQLDWSTSNASSFSISGIGALPLNGSYNVYPTVSNTSYTGSVNGGGTCQTTVNIAPTPLYYLPGCPGPGFTNLYTEPGFNGGSLSTANQYVNQVNYGPNPLGGPACIAAGSQCYLNDVNSTWTMNCDGIPESACTSVPNACGQTNTGWTINGSGCTASAPSNASCPAPTVSNVTISAPNVVPDGSTTYTITTTGSDALGSGDLAQQYALINYQGSNAGAYRGMFWWGANSGLGWGPPTAAAIACSGGGVAQEYGDFSNNNAYGAAYANLISCATSVSGNTRTSTWTVSFNPSFTTPTTGNNISGYVWGILNNAGSGWVNFNTNFGLTIPMPNPVGTTVTPLTATVGVPVTFVGSMTNSGNASTGSSFPSWFIITTTPGNGAGDVFDNNITAPALAAGASQNITDPSYTFASPGTYYGIVCAGYDSSWNRVPANSSGGGCGPNYGSPIIVSAPVPTGSFTGGAPSCTIPSGNASCTASINWTSANVVSVNLTNSSGSTIVNKPVGAQSYSPIIIPYAGTTFNIANASGGAVLATTPATASCIGGTSWNGSSCAPSCIPTLSASPSTIIAGQSTSFTWNESASCASSCQFSDGHTAGISGNGAYTVTPPTPGSGNTDTYSITCPNGTPANTAQTIITFLLPTDSITATPRRVKLSSPNSTIAWTASNVTSCSIAKNGTTWQASLPVVAGSVAGNQSDSIVIPTTYVMTCLDTVGALTATSYATTTVTTVPTFEAF